MPTLEHESLVQLFRNRPALAAELIHEALGMEVPSFDRAGTESIDFTDIDPAECRCDHVAVFEQEGKPVLAIAVEVQRGIDTSKLHSWPVFASSLRRRLSCAAGVLVLATTDEIARWAARPINMGLGNEFRVLAIGPAGVPFIDDTDRAASSPELAVLAATTYGRDPDVEKAVRMALIAFAAIQHLDPDRRELYSDMIMAALSEAARKAVQMLPQGYQYQSELARSSQARSKAEDIIEVLEVRGLAITDEQRERINTCSTIDTLRRWLRKAATATSTDDVFTE